MTEQIVEYIKITMIVLAVWGFGLTFSCTRLIGNLHKVRDKCRREDVVHGLSTFAYVLFAVTILVFYPTLIDTHSSAFIAMCIGTLFTLSYLTEHQLHSHRAVQELIKNKLTSPV